VLAGGVLGAAARQAVEQALPTWAGHFPAATLVINLAGAFVLGALVAGLARLGPDSGVRRRVRLLAGTGFCGAFTTYSTLAVETVQLARHGAWSSAGLYLVVSAAGGLLAALAGITAGTAHAHRLARWLPVDPDPEEE
jgi:CrcB protein